MTNAIDEIKVTMIFLRLHFFVVNKLKGRELFPDRMNINHLDLVLGRRDSNCCTMDQSKIPMDQSKIPTDQSKIPTDQSKIPTLL